MNNDNMDPNYKRLSVEEMNKIILEKIPLEERLRAVYLPIIVMDCCCYLSEDLLLILRTLRLDNTKKASRVIRNCVDGYRSDNYRVMHYDLYKDLMASTKEFYNSLSRDMIIYQLQYRQALLNIGLHLNMEVEKLIVVAYIVRELVRFVLELDRKFSKRMSDLLGKDINYTTEDNHYCLEMIKAINGIFSVLKVPGNLRTDQTDMAFKVFKNRLNSVKI